MRKRTSLNFLLLASALLLMTGCASSVMTPAKPLAVESTGKALVTFVRPSYFGGAIQFGLWDSGRFVGVLSAGSSVEYLAEPGEHLFLACAENWSYVKADLESGKKYYVGGRVFPGVWKARVALDPVVKGDGTTDAEIEKWAKDLTPMSVLPEKYEEYAAPRVLEVKAAVEEFENGNVKYGILRKEDGR